MATWIVHLRVAEHLLSAIPGLHPVSFAVGNIAPDSGIPDEKWEQFDPPPELTHFGNFPGAQRKLADLEFHRRYLLPLRGVQAEANFSFRLGYFFHLVTDNLWRVKIAVPVTERFSAQFAADRDFIWEVKKDWYGLDFIYVRDHPDSLFWNTFLQSKPETGDLEFLPLEAVRQRIEYIQQYYRRTDETVQNLYNRPYQYLSRGEMDAFVDETARHLFRIYQYVWFNAGRTDGLVSAIDLTGV